MGEATFYRLNGEAAETVLPRLLDLSLRQGWRVELRGQDAERMDGLDLSLWEDGFQPHGRAGGPHDALQPVLLTVEPRPQGRDCLVALDGAAIAVEEAASLRRVLVVFDGADASALAAARAQWKALTAAGLPARFYERENGGWTLREERSARPPGYG